ncbi:MAG: winged helix-turn-helix domain-containing protein [Candidatus Binatia bacterium]
MSAISPNTNLFFGSFRLDLVNQCLWRGRRRLLLRPKTFAVLDLLVKHAGQLVMREELLEAVWPDTYVSDGALRFCIRDLRKMLRDTARVPLFIETVHRRGYRFVAPLQAQSDDLGDASARATSSPLSKIGRAKKNMQQFLHGEQVSRNIYQETIAHLTNGIALVQTLPHSPERTQQELALHLALGAPLTAIKGHASSEVQQIYTRARELCRQAGETPQLFPVLYGLTVNAIVRGELQLAREVSERVLDLARAFDDQACLAAAHIAYGAVLLWLGEVETGNAYLTRGLTFCDAQSHAAHMFLYGMIRALSAECLRQRRCGYWDMLTKRSCEARKHLPWLAPLPMRTTWRLP